MRFASADTPLATVADGLLRRLLRQHSQRTSIVKAELVRLARGQGDQAAIAPALLALLLGLLPRAASDPEAQLGLLAAARLVVDERSSGLESAIMESGATRCLVHSLLGGAIADMVAAAIEGGDEHHAARLCGGLATIVGALARQSCSRRDLDAIFVALRATNRAPRPETPAAQRARALGAVTVLRALCDALWLVDDRSPRAYVAFRPTAAAHTLSGAAAARCSVRIAVGRPPPAASKAPLNLLRAGVTFSAWIRIEDPRSVRRQRSSPGSPAPRVVLSPRGSFRERRSRRRSAGESELCVLARIEARTRASIYLRHGPAGTDLMVGISPSTAPPSPKAARSAPANDARDSNQARSKADAGLFRGLFGALLGDAAAPSVDAVEESEQSPAASPARARNRDGGSTPPGDDAPCPATPLTGSLLAANAASVVEFGEDVISVAGNLPRRQWVWISVSIDGGGGARAPSSASEQAEQGGGAARSSWFGGAGAQGNAPTQPRKRRGTRIVTAIAESVAAVDVGSGVCTHPRLFDGRIGGGALSVHLGGFDGELTDAMLCAPALGVAGIGELWGLARRTPPLVKRAPLRAAAKQPGPPTVAAARAAVRAGSSTAGSGGWWPWMDSAESDARRAAEDNASPRADRSAAGKGKSAAQPKVRSLFFVRTSFFTFLFAHSSSFLLFVCAKPHPDAARVPNTASVVLFSLSERAVAATVVREGSCEDEADAAELAATSGSRAERAAAAVRIVLCAPVGAAWHSLAYVEGGARALLSTSSARDAFFACGGPAVTLPLLLCAGSACASDGDGSAADGPRGAASPRHAADEWRASRLQPLIPRCALLRQHFRADPATCAALPVLGLRLLDALICDGGAHAAAVDAHANANASGNSAAARSNARRALHCGGAAARRHGALARKQRLLVCAGELLERLAPSQLSVDLWRAAHALGETYVATATAHALRALAAAGIDGEAMHSAALSSHPCVAWACAVVDDAAHDAHVALALSPRVWARAAPSARREGPSFISFVCFYSFVCSSILLFAARSILAAKCCGSC